MSKVNSVACNEYEALSRRGFISKSAGAALAISAPFWLPRVSYAQGSRATTKDTIISVYLRGGFDGLTFCAPFFENSYYTLRPNLAVPRPDSSSTNRGINLDGKFALPKAMASLLEPYQSGQLLYVHAVGSTNWTRSHFEAQRWMERGVITDNFGEGWLAKYLQTSPPMSREAILRGVSMTFGMRQTLAGAPSTLPIGEIERFGYQGEWTNEAEIVNILQELYADCEVTALRTAAAETQRTIDFLERVGFNTYNPAGGAVYPTTVFGMQMKATAALIKAGVGVEAIHLDLEGWDTHANQGPFDGHMATMMKDVADSMRAFWQDMNASNQLRWTMAVMSEFGRTAAQNNSAGTDHGTANAMMLMGPGIAGGRVLTNWPGLHPDLLFQGLDLMPTIDHRDILSEVLRKRAAVKDFSTIFPGYTPVFRGVAKHS